MTTSLTKNEKNYWKKYKTDLLQGIDVCLNKNQLFAAGKLIFCAFDSLAAFYIGYNDKRSRNKKVLSGGGGRSRGNIYESSSVKKYFDNYLKNCCNHIYRKTIKINNKKEAMREVLYEDYRCGLVHEGRPKRNLKLSMDKKSLFDNSSLSLIIMKKILLNSIKIFDGQLGKNGYRVRRWRERYDYLVK